MCVSQRVHCLYYKHFIRLVVKRRHRPKKKHDLTFALEIIYLAIFSTYNPQHTGYYNTSAVFVAHRTISFFLEKFEQTKEAPKSLSLVSVR